MIMGSKAGGFGMVSPLDFTCDASSYLCRLKSQWFIGGLNVPPQDLPSADLRSTVFGIGVFCAISISCAASRATWAFARDKAIPFHRTFSVVNSRFSDIPLNAYLLSMTIQLLLGLLYLGSSAAFNAFSGVAVICLGASNAMPIAISLLNGRKDVSDSPFPLGRFGYALNTVAVLWVVFQIVLFSMPSTIPVTRSTMSEQSVPPALQICSFARVQIMHRLSLSVSLG